jgi:hypothetical protein
MAIDLDQFDLDPGTRMHAELFATSVSAMPTEALDFLIELLKAERESRG